MQVLFDTNILLDAVLAREPFSDDAAFLLTLVELAQLTGFVSATTVTDVYYVVRRQTRSAETAMSAVNKILELMEICTVDRAILEQAVLLSQDDFEDAVQIACALSLGLDAIVTRDIDGFAGSTILAISPGNLRSEIEQL